MADKSRDFFPESIDGQDFAGSYLTESPAETHKVAAGLAKHLNSGDVLFLHGDLGAGKTEFVRGLAHALGSSDEVQSPSFGLVHEYTCQCPETGRRKMLYHLDFYRLENAAQIEAAGLTPYFEPDGISVIEWPTRWEGRQYFNPVQVTLKIIGGTGRRIEIGLRGNAGGAK